jgi:hypothetical protein
LTFALILTYRPGMDRRRFLLTSLTGRSLRRSPPGGAPTADLERPKENHR